MPNEEGPPALRGSAPLVKTAVGGRPSAVGSGAGRVVGGVGHLLVGEHADSEEREDSRDEPAEEDGQKGAAGREVGHGVRGCSRAPNLSATRRPDIGDLRNRS